jgi:hypothetical protein
MTKFGPPSGPPPAPSSASKFLPFITEKSSPLTIFKALVQRSKGLSNQDLCILFSAILCVGINAIKEKVKKSPHTNQSTKQIFSSLVAHYPQFKPSIYSLRFWELILKNHGLENIKTNTEYTREELTILFSCLAEHKKDYLPEIGFDIDMEYLNLFSKEDYIHKLSETPDLCIDNQENKIEFNNIEDFKAYIAYKLAKREDISFYPVVKKQRTTSDRDPFTGYTYSEKSNEVPF